MCVCECVFLLAVWAHSDSEKVTVKRWAERVAAFLQLLRFSPCCPMNHSSGCTTSLLLLIMFCRCRGLLMTFYSVVAQLDVSSYRIAISKCQ